MNPADKARQEINQISNFCQLPITKNLLRKMEKEYLIPYLDKSNNSRGNYYISKDNHLVKSSYELLFSNFLFLNGIQYTYDKVIPVDGPSFRYDFRIGDKFIELFCYYGDEYKERTEVKTHLYKSNCLDLIKLDLNFFKDAKFRVIYYKFTDLMKTLGIKHDDFAEYNQEDFLYGSKDYLDYIQKTLREYIQENSTLPNSDQIRQMGLSGLERIINKLGGYKEVCNLLGLDDDKFRNSWDKYNLDKEFFNLCSSVNRIPTDKDYHEAGLSGLLRHIRKNKIKDELEKLARDKGFQTFNEITNRNPSGTWSLQLIIKTIEPICEHLGWIPSKAELVKLGFSGLEAAISQYTSREELSKILGYPTINRMNGVQEYTLNELIAELEPFTKEKGYFSSKNDLININKAKLLYHINKFGGTAELAKIMNVPTSAEYHGKKENGYWNDEEEVRNKINFDLLPIVEELGYIPNESYLRELARKDLSYLIYIYGGREKLSKELHYPTYNEFHNKKENGYWDKEGNRLKEHLLPICEELGHVPSHSYLKHKGLGYIISGINTFNGSLSKLTGFPRSSEYKGLAPKGSNNNIEYLRSYVEPIINSLGYFPTKEQLAERGLKKLEKSIRIFGGRRKVAQIFNTKCFADIK